MKYPAVLNVRFRFRCLNAVSYLYVVLQYTLYPSKIPFVTSSDKGFHDAIRVVEFGLYDVIFVGEASGTAIIHQSINYYLQQ